MLQASPSRGEEKALDPPVKALMSMDVLDNQRKLKPGDHVSIRIAEDKRDAVQQVVAVTGEVQAPYLGMFKATGLTSRKLAYKLKAELEKSFFKEATVIVFITQSLHAWVSSNCSSPEFVVAYGKVSKPGKYEFPYDKGLTVTRFLKLAGGYTSQGQLPKIQIVRHTPQGNKHILVHTRAILIERRSEYDIFLRAQDVVIVE